MFSAMLLAISIVALSQFAIYYWRAVLAGVAAQPVSDRVLIAAQVKNGRFTPEDFQTLDGGRDCKPPATHPPKTVAGRRTCPAPDCQRAKARTPCCEVQAGNLLQLLRKGLRTFRPARRWPQPPRPGARADDRRNRSCGRPPARLPHEGRRRRSRGSLPWRFERPRWTRLPCAGRRRWRAGGPADPA